MAQTLPYAHTRTHTTEGKEKTAIAKRWTAERNAWFSGNDGVTYLNVNAVTLLRPLVRDCCRAASEASGIYVVAEGNQNNRGEITTVRKQITSLSDRWFLQAKE